VYVGSMKSIGQVRTAIRRTSVCWCLAALALRAPAQEPATLSSAPPPSAEGLRVSALIQFTGGTKVGMVDTKNHTSFFLGVGERKHGFKLVSADFDAEEIILEKDNVTWRMELEKDPNAPAIPVGASPPQAPATPVYRGEGIEAFLREHPDAVVKGTVPELQAPPPGTEPVEGFGPGIEKFLAEDPELAERVSQPAVGKGETIERFLRENPELAEEVNKPVTGKGEGIERFLREQPNIRPQGIPPEAFPPGVTPPPAPSR